MGGPTHFCRRQLYFFRRLKTIPNRALKKVTPKQSSLSRLVLCPRRWCGFNTARGLSTKANSAASQPVEGKSSMSKDSDILKDAKESFEQCAEREQQNRADALDDIRFARLAEQWPDAVRRSREREGRPCLTINRLPAFVRQVVNDARQNKPSIKVHPADSKADPETAEIYDGLIRNIEVTSKADVAYDTALESAASGGFGYFRIATSYASDDSFDLDLAIERIANPFSVYGDPYSAAADSADWNTAFVVDRIQKKQFELQYKGAEEVDWQADGTIGLNAPWFENEEVMVAEWWRREKVRRTILLLSDQTVMEAETYLANKGLLDAMGVSVLGERETASHKVTQRLLTGAEVLE